MADFLVTIGADAAQYQNAMQAAANTATQTASTVDGAGRRITTAITATGTAVRAGSERAGFALTNLGRVVQDAPFGFIAIQNNISPLLDSFTSLQRETGSAGSAFKALFSSLAGPAGIGIAVALVTSAITLFIQHQQSANKVVKDAKKTTDDYAKSLDGVSQALLKGQQNGQKEVTRLDILYNATQNHTLSLLDRNKAYDELESKYPAFFNNASREKTILGENGKAYIDLSHAILAAAYAKAAEEQIGNNSMRQFENDRKLNMSLFPSFLDCLIFPFVFPFGFQFFSFSSFQLIIYLFIF